MILAHNDPSMAQLRAIPRRIAPFSKDDVAHGDFVAGNRFTPFYLGDGNLWFIYDNEGGEALTGIPQFERYGPPAPMWWEVERTTQATAARRRFVYFIGTLDTAIKIGTSYSAEERFKAIQAHSPVQLAILAIRPGGEATESAYHEWFREHRLHGEWFAPHPDILAEIDRINSSAALSEVSQ